VSQPLTGVPIGGGGPAGTAELPSGPSARLGSLGAPTLFDGSAVDPTLVGPAPTGAPTVDATTVTGPTVDPTTVDATTVDATTVDATTVATATGDGSSSTAAAGSPGSPGSTGADADGHDQPPLPLDFADPLVDPPLTDEDQTDDVGTLFAPPRWRDSPR
jgi:hypothetical protein